MDKLTDFWNIGFWDKKDIQVSLPEAIKEKGVRERIRKIERDHSAINEAQQWEPRYFLKILNTGVNLLNLPDGYKGNGRPSIPISEKLKIICIKQHELKGARNTVHEIESAKAMGYVFTNISRNYFNRINEYMRDPALTPYLQQLVKLTSEPLSKYENFFAVDMSGMKIYRGKPSYRDIRTNRKEKGNYLGLNIISGVKSKIIPYAIISKGHEHEIKFFKELVEETRKIFRIKEIYTDKGYFSKDNIKFCENLGIKLFVPPRSNMNINKLRSTYYKRTINRYYEDLEKGEDRRYTLRNNIEASFHMIKTVLSDVLRHKTHIGRKNEILARIVCHNIRILVNEYQKNNMEFPFGLKRF